MSETRILPALQPEQVEQARTLVLEYVNGLGIDLDFQDFEQEMREFPSDYAPPDGCLLLAMDAQGPAGCVGLRKLEPGICEMKRLYVRPRCRGQGLGQRLAQAVIEEARVLGYSAMRLDTLSTMHSAIGTYRGLGFQPIAAYYRNPIEGALFFELKLG
ncbi:GNAT family N-acetyltransferase [Hyalangium rubrum]|uniref:GNAT family N-acetyltransferase n=1 Tax=Hyalangium rubrum TaxID=3103134 RepID=A0ABU5H0N1_9BACT|nr:GNAT family N-acetyltransferase [Hyalangium sp. s54d21]MDY7226318.1 GNAT family N-acetyltransferase [Hyalangium sp. s54d21]